MRFRCAVCLFVLAFHLAGDSSEAVHQLEVSARQKLDARDVAGALAAYAKLAELVPASAAYQDETGFLLAATNGAGVVSFGRWLDDRQPRRCWNQGSAKVC